MRMTMPGKNDSWLTNWLYDSAEWKRFLRWEMLKKGGIHLLKLLVMPLLPGKPKEVKISKDTVLIGRKTHRFHTDNREFQTADLYEAGPMHILEICYKEKEKFGVIRVPVPKGKLKDAILLEKNLIREKP